MCKHTLGHSLCVWHEYHQIKTVQNCNMLCLHCISGISVDFSRSCVVWWSWSSTFPFPGMKQFSFMWRDGGISHLNVLIFQQKLNAIQVTSQEFVWCESRRWIEPYCGSRGLYDKLITVHQLDLFAESWGHAVMILCWKGAASQPLQMYRDCISWWFRAGGSCWARYRVKY